LKIISGRKSAGVEKAADAYGSSFVVISAIF